jgi:uncharacterized protein
MTETVLVVAKAPLPGRAKTRLVPPLSADDAADLQRALLLDTLDACRVESFEPTVLAAGDGAGAGLRETVGHRVRVEPQEGRGLADALRLGMRRFLAGGPVAIVSSDVPGLPPGSLPAAFEALADGADVVLGPAVDGGYWLIGMSRPHEEAFADIPWSTPSVCATTRARCEAAGLQVHELDAWSDVDTAVDLALLAQREDLAAARTEAFVQRLRQEGHLTAETAPGLVSSEIVLASPWRSLLSDRLASSNGRPSGYAYLEVPRAVFVVPLTPEDDVVLVRQYRHPVRDWTLEVPAGSVDAGESPLEAAERELAEEVGGRSDDWRHLSSFYSSSAHMSLRSDAFLARGVRLATPSRDAGETISVVRLPWAEAVTRARRGGFAEGQTALALLLAAEACGDELPAE